MKPRRETLVGKRFWLRAADHSITALGTGVDPDLSEGDTVCQNMAEFRRATAEWAVARLVTVWNCLPGGTPIRKFTDRGTAVKRIWTAIQDLAPDAAATAPSESQPAKVKARAGTKKEQLLSLLARRDGATIAEAMAVLGWQSHSVRGCLSTLAKKGLPVHSFRRCTGERAYSTRAPEANAEVME